MENAPQSEKTNKPRHPLGPILFPVHGFSRNAIRFRAILVMIGGLLLASISIYLTPSKSGVGTHTQLGFPPCGMVRMFNMPCPTCGMTTAFAWTIRGRPIKAFHAQPFGFLLAATVFSMTLFSGWVAVTGRCWAINWYRVSMPKTGLIILILFLLAWVYKIADMRDWL